MKNLFISYSPADSRSARKLAEELEKRGVSCWLEHEDRPKDLDRATATMQGLGSCGATLVLLSQNSARSSPMRRAVEHASSLKHRFYSARLQQVDPSDDLAFFLKEDDGVDLFTGDTTKAYAELAAAILEGRGVALRRRKLPSKRIVSIAVLLLAVIGAVGYVAYNKLRDYERAIVDVGAPHATDGAWDALSIGLDIQPDNTHGRNFATGWFLPDGIPLQTAPVQLALYEEMAGQPVRKIAFVDEKLKLLSGSQMADFIALEKPQNYLICFLFRAGSGPDAAGPDKSFIAIERRLAHTFFDPDRTITEVEDGVGCDEFLEASQVQDPDWNFEGRMELAEHTANYAKLGIVEVQYNKDYPGTDNVVLELEKGRDQRKNRLSTAQLFVRTGPDGSNWGDADVSLLADTVLRSALATPGDKGLTSAKIAQPMLEYVHVCVTTGLTDGEGFLHEKKVFRRAPDESAYAAIDELSTTGFDRDGTYCQ